jgi:hypothetical protein
MVTTRTARFGAVAIVAALGFAAAVSSPTPAEAGVFGGFGFGIPIRFPFYYPPYPYYPPPAITPPRRLIPRQGRPISRQPVILPRARRSPTRRGAAGRTRRVNIAGEYRTTGPSGNRATERYGTACRDASGQWRVVN